jgi:hypothetical protein
VQKPVAATHESNRYERLESIRTLEVWKRWRVNAVAICLTVTPTSLSDVIYKDCIREIEIERFVEKLNCFRGLSYFGLQTFKKYKYGSCTSRCQDPQFV